MGKLWRKQDYQNRFVFDIISVRKVNVPDSIEIMVMSGPYDGSIHRLTTPHEPSSGYVIGRRDECDLSFPFDRLVSSRHARLFKNDGVWYLEDLGSTNKTFIDKRRADGSFAGRERIEGIHAVAIGQLIQLGRLWIRLQSE